MPLIPVLTTDVDGVSKYATANGMSFRDPIDAEQLLKAADDLDNASYWTVTTDTTITEPSAGVFRITKTAATWKGVYQTLTNWFPEWGATFSMLVWAKAGTLDKLRMVLYADANTVTEVEKISGDGSISIVSTFADISGLGSEWSVFRITGTASGWSTTLRTELYPDGGGSTAGYMDITNAQIILGSTAKPRPTQTDPDDWMMAYRPHNRVTADGAARFYVNCSEDKVWCGELGDTAAAPTSGGWSVIHGNGITVPAYGDPWIGLTQPDGSAFSVGASDAVMFKVTTNTAAKDAQFGFDSATAGELVEPRFKLTGNTLVVDTATADETPQTWTAGTTQSFIQLLRSDTHGGQFLLHDSAKAWDRINVNADAIPAASAYPAISIDDASLIVHEFALLDLSSLHTSEWVGGGSDLGGVLGATDLVLTPADEDTYTHTDDFLAILRGVTLPSAGNMEFNFRQAGADEITLRIDDGGDTTLLDNGNPDIGPVVGAISDTEDAMVHCNVADGEVFVEGASIGSTAALSITSGTGGKRDDATDGAATSLELWPDSATILNPAK